MGYLHLQPFFDLYFELDDVSVASVFEAAQQGLREGMFISLCGADGESGGYLEVDAALFVPEVTAHDGTKIVDGGLQLWLKPLFVDEPVAADEVLVDQLLEVMKETDGCIVIGADNELVLSLERAQQLRVQARRVNPFEDIVFPNPSHDD